MCVCARARVRARARVCTCVCVCARAHTFKKSKIEEGLGPEEMGWQSSPRLQAYSCHAPVQTDNRMG